MRFVATDGVAWHHICYINDETAMRFVAQNALVCPFCLLRGAKTTINIPLLTIHYASNLPCADARAVRPYMPLTCKSFFNRTNPKVQSSKFNVQSQSPYMPDMVILMHKMVGGTGYAAAFIQPFTIFCRPGTSIRTISFSRTKIKLSRSSSLSVRIKELF